MAKIKLEDIQKEIEIDGWKVLSEEYKNLESEMVFECEEGHKVYAPWKKIRTRRECPVCKALSYKENGEKILAKPKGAKRVIGIDQATKVSGYSVFDNKKLVKYGTFLAPENASEIERDYQIKMWVISLIHAWKPDYIGLEGIQFQTSVNGQNSNYGMGVTTFETLARLQGILMETCHELGVPFEICPTNTWRHFCGVKGKYRSDKKRSMQTLAKKWYDVNLTQDEADAVGIGRYISEKFHSQIDVENWE